MNSIFDGIITSKMRIRILMRLFLNPNQQAYLRELAKEFDVSTSQVSGELQKLSEAGLLTNVKKGNQIKYRANVEHTLFPELQSMVRKSLGMDKIIDSIIERLGDLEKAILVDDYAEGKDTGIIDLVLVGDIDLTNLSDLVRKTEQYISRKIRTLVINADEYKRMNNSLKNRKQLVLWEKQV